MYKVTAKTIDDRVLAAYGVYIDDATLTKEHFASAKNVVEVKAKQIQFEEYFEDMKAIETGKSDVILRKMEKSNLRDEKFSEAEIQVAEKYISGFPKRTKDFYQEMNARDFLTAAAVNMGSNIKFFTTGLFDLEYMSKETFKDYLINVSEEIERSGHIESEGKRLLRESGKAADKRYSEECKGDLMKLLKNDREERKRYEAEYLIEQGCNSKNLKDILNNSWDVSRTYAKDIQDCIEKIECNTVDIRQGEEIYEEI
ncbi:MAG: hypothetical protein KH297_04615 [Firmicutes bacterium]|nr:hypothetical protein [Bacillota bacterium]